MKKVILKFSIGLIFLLGVLSPFIFTNSDKVVKENAEYEWIKTYTLFNRDSAIYKVHKPIIFKGKITEAKYSGSNKYWIEICYGNNKTYSGKIKSYNKIKKGDNVKVTEYYHPYPPVYTQVVISIGQNDKSISKSSSFYTFCRNIH